MEKQLVAPNFPNIKPLKTYACLMDIYQGGDDAEDALQRLTRRTNGLLKGRHLAASERYAEGQFALLCILYVMAEDDLQALGKLTKFLRKRASGLYFRGEPLFKITGAGLIDSHKERNISFR